MYLNAIYYGNGYWGCAAARGYFHTVASRLTWAEAAMLAGLPQAPSAYDPIDHLDSQGAPAQGARTSWWRPTSSPRARPYRVRERLPLS